jgi:hypothetical protein
VDNGSHLPSLRDQSSWTPLPVASLRAVDAPGPSSADVYPSDSSLADALAADDVRFLLLISLGGQMCQLRELIDGGVVRPPCFLSTLLVLFFSCFCLTMFSYVFSFRYSFHFFRKSSWQSSSSSGYARAYGSSTGPSTFEPFSWRHPAEVSFE